MYLVKWKNLSYLHCSWETESSLMALEGSRMKQKIIVCVVSLLNSSAFSGTSQTSFSTSPHTELTSISTLTSPRWIGFWMCASCRR